MDKLDRENRHSGVFRCISTLEMVMELLKRVIWSTIVLELVWTTSPFRLLLL